MNKTALPLLFAVLLAGFAPFGNAQNTDLAALQAELNRLRAENAALKSQVADLKRRLGDDDAVDPPANPALQAEVQDLRQQLSVSEESRQILEAEKKQLQVLAGLPTKQDNPHARLTARFDGDLTTVTAEPITVPASTKLLEVVHRLGASFSHRGQTAAGPIDQAQLIVTTVSNPKNYYKNLKTITLIAGDERFELPVKQYEILNQQRSGGRTRITRYDEQLTAGVTYAQIKAIALKSPLRLKIGSRNFPLTHDHEALIDAVAERLRQSGAQ